MWEADADGYKTFHIYFLYSGSSSPDAYRLGMDFTTQSPCGVNRIPGQTEYLPGPDVYIFEVRGPMLFLILRGFDDTVQTDCKVFVHAQSRYHASLADDA